MRKLMLLLLPMLLLLSCQSLGQKETVRVPEIDWPEFPILEDARHPTEEEVIRLAKFKVWYEANLNYYEQLEELYNDNKRPN